jgi:membrane peptidoglycan carboxypeptidase
LLAGLINAPSANDPQAHFDQARARQLDVLKAMVATGALSQADADKAAGEDIQKELKFLTVAATTRAPHFVDYVMQTLEADYGAAAVQQGGLHVYTTIDPNLQGLAEASVSTGVAALASTGVDNGMLLAARPDTGEILAWVGSVDYGNQPIGGQFDIVRSPRQPGSSFKPYVYEAALKDHKITLASCLQDRPTDFGGGYRPLDFDNAYMGNISARTALVESRNIPAVQVAQMEGIGNVISLAKAMGIRTKLQPYLSTAIGGSEVTMFDHLQGYQVLAHQGRKVPLLSISRITDASNSTLFNTKPQDGQTQVVSPEEAYLITDVLKGYQQAWNLGWDRQMAGKSGTSGASQVGVHQDAWMMAYNPDIVVGAWTGNTTAGGGGTSISAFGTETGQKLLAEFINHLPSQWSHWYQQPSGLLSHGELFLQGTQSLSNACAGGGDRVNGGGGGDHGHKQGGGGQGGD